MLPRVQAERDLRMLNVAAAASGNLKPDALRRYVRRLELDAGIREKPVPGSRDPWGMGIPVIEETAGE